MPGEMSQMIPERPNADAVRHQDRCGIIRNPRRQGFVPIVAHGTTPTDVVEFREYPHGWPAFTTSSRLGVRFLVVGVFRTEMPALARSCASLAFV
jgi:hypothetical protein